MKNKILYLIIFILISSFPILSFKLKSISAFSFIILAFFSLKQKDQPFNYIYLINSCLYLLYILSLCYSENIGEGITILERNLSLLVFPLSFMLFSGNTKAISLILKFDFLLKNIFIYSTFLLSILLFTVSLEFGNYFEHKINLELFVNKLNFGFFWLNDHPIYLSIYLSISLLMVCNLFNTESKKHKIILIFIAFFQLFILLLLSRKGIIISFFISLLIYFLMTRKNKLKVFFFVSFITFLSSFFVSKYIPDTSKRFMEVFDSKSYKKVENFSSTSIRYGVYKCALKKISNSWLFGYGIGDVSKELKNCYKKTSIILFKNEYNSHNQYFGILLYVGFLGLSLFFIILLLNLKILYNNNDYYAFCLLIMFMLFMMTENILDRQNGVILFSFFFNFYFFKNYLKLKNTIFVKKSLENKTT